MSNKNTKKKNTTKKSAKAIAKKQAKAFAMQKSITIFALLILLVIGLVSTTFASFITDNTGKSGSLIADIQTLAVSQGNKTDVVDTKANIDVAETSATITSDGTARLYFNMKAVSWWTAGSNGNGNFAYFFNNSTGKNAWSAHAVNYSGDTYYVVIPSGSWAGVILTRNNTSTSPSWDNKWNQTGDITLSSTSNYLSKFSEGSTSVTWGTAVKPTSTARLSASPSPAETNTAVTLTPSLYTNSSINTIKSTTYTISPTSGASISGNTFTATAAGTYTVTATVTYTPNCYSSITSTTTATTTITVNNPKYTYTITKGTGGIVSPTSGSVNVGSSVTITATPNTGYTFAGWTGATNGTLGSTSSATTTFKPTANGATVKANFRPNAPSALTLTASGVASGTSGTGASTNPYIVFSDGNFTLTANATVVTDAVAHYSTTATSGYSTTKTFTPARTTKGADQSYTVYAKAYAGGYYSSNYISKTVHYMVFSHLVASNTGFTMSDDSITDAQSVTFSGAYVNGVDEAEKAYITQVYQMSTNNSSFSDIQGSSWTPNQIGTYYFRVKTTNTKTGEVVYSTSQRLTVEQSTVYYKITVVNDGSVDADVTLSTDGTEITTGQILSNSPLSISLTRPDTKYYIEYLEVDTITEFDNEYVNGDIIDYLACEHVKGNVEIHYKLTEKPKVKVLKPANSTAIEFAYYSDGTLTKATAESTYHVDYNKNIKYSVTPNAGFYVKSMNGVEIGEITASTVSGTKNSVTADIQSVTATLADNNTITVNVDTSSDVTEGGSITIDSTPYEFGTAKALNYGVKTVVVITPPEDYYALVSGNDVNSTISTDGKATFDVTLTGDNEIYTVKFIKNPKIFMVQPEYGSVYVTSGTGEDTRYYFNGDSVGYGTELKINVKPDHANAILNDVLVNDASIGNTDGSTFEIVEDSTATAGITVNSDFAFDTITSYGSRRIFFTDTCAWGNSNAQNVLVHCSDKSGDTDFTKNNITMTRKYYNDYSQYVYYADIPFGTKYVTFVNASNSAQYSTQGTVSVSNNAYYMSNTGNYPRAVDTWQFNYSDFIATDRADTIQQASTSKGTAATFQYTCDFGDDALTAEVISGNDATFDFDKGTLSITPTENTETYSLVKVTSSASTTVKYYLIRVENFEIESFTGLQKIYKANIINNVQLDLIVKGGVLNYAAALYSSDTNVGEYESLTVKDSTGFEKNDTIQAYINSFLIEFSVSGVKYIKAEATDGAGRKATSYMKTLFGTHEYNGERALYFYNNTNVNMSKYNLRACFMDADENNKTFVTMQKVGNTDYYRAVIPNASQSKVNFYLCNPKTFSNNFDDYDGEEDSIDFYSYGIMGLEIPTNDDANIVFKATSIGSDGILGGFVNFDY